MARTYSKCAIEVMREQQKTRLWFGDSQLWSEIHARKNSRFSKQEQWAAVYNSIRRSHQFQQVGYILIPADDDAGRGDKHPVFQLMSLKEIRG